MKCIRNVQRASGIHLAPYSKGTVSPISPIKWSGSEAIVKNDVAARSYVPSWYVKVKVKVSPTTGR